MPPEIEQIIADTIALTGSSMPPSLAGDSPVLSPASLSDEPISAGAEPMYLIGLIGGKDVGKSSFVNALVGQKISEQTSHGPGTEVVVAYAHEGVVKPLRELLDREVPGRFKIYAHTIPGLLRQVLLDLPDIDSVYSDHIEITRTMLRQMLYPIWIQSVEKYADQQPQQLLARVAEGNDPANFIFCLNKVDQLVGRDGLAASVQLRDDYALRLGRLLKLPQPPRVYLVSAKSSTEFDFPSLRDLLSKQKTMQVVRDSQQLAGRQQMRTILAWLDRQQLPARSQRIARLREEAGEMIASRVAVPILEGALPQLVNDPAYRLSIIDPVVTARMSHWPIVNILHGLLAPVLAIVRRNIGAGPGNVTNVDDYLSMQGQSLATMVQTTFAQLQQANPTIGALYRENKLWESMPSESAAQDLRMRLNETLDRQREAAMQRIGRRRGIIAPIFRTLLTIGAILWFPIVQPMLEIVLQTHITSFSRELALKIVQLLGTTFLLKNLIFLLLYFAVLWAVIRASVHGRVSRLISRWQSDPELDPALSFNGQAMEWIDEMLDPIQR
ncbi:MAG TPA: GTPase domain-containing protein, partial [Tepidisphaeraceae bacterium]|nr:GTPase domain-containing protein [Tepidisphaeraceae bacterium]